MNIHEFGLWLNLINNSTLNTNETWYKVLPHNFELTDDVSIDVYWNGKIVAVWCVYGLDIWDAEMFLVSEFREFIKKYVDGECLKGARLVGLNF